MTPADRIEHHELPSDRKVRFATEVCDRYKQVTGNVEKAILEMYLSGISARKIAKRLQEGRQAWRKRLLKKAHPYLYSMSVDGP